MFLILFNLFLIGSIIAIGFLFLILIAFIWDLIDNIKGNKQKNNKVMEFISYEIK